MQKTFQKGMPEGHIQEYPVTAENFPPEAAKVASPREGESLGLKPPTQVSDEGFGSMVAETLLVRQSVVSGKWPGEFMKKYGGDEFPPAPLREQLGGIKAQAAADIVHMDKPDDLGRILIDWLNETDPVAAKTGHIHFVNGLVGGLVSLLESVQCNLNDAFIAKWFFGASRPEERIPLGSRWTHYYEGCPPHPRYPAGHGAAAGRTAQWLIENRPMSDESKEVVLQSAFHFAMYRTFSGMHDAEDNLAGLALSPVMRERFEAVSAQYVG